MKHVEIEQKFQLISPAEELKATLTERGAKQGEESRQIDTYYNAPHKDFLAGDVISEWLRVREEGEGKASLNFKRWYPLEEKIKTHCDEFESPITEPEAVTKLLAALDFKQLVTVDKVREEWMCDGVAVAFDTVADLGTFIEFEFKGEAETIEDGIAQLEAFIAGLGIELGDRINAGYPHLALGLVSA